VIKYEQMAMRHGAVRITELGELPEETVVTFFGIISSLKKIFTKDKKEMAFLSVEDVSGNTEVVVFPSVFEQFDEYIKAKDVIVITGRLSGGKVLADKIMYPEEFAKQSLSQMHILLSDPLEEEKLIKLRDIFIQNKGRCSVYIHTQELDSRRKAVRASTFLLVEPHEELISLLRKENLVEKVWVS